jgi:prepilin-type N-terminal cleavage/methylation domain-containing protein
MDRELRTKSFELGRHQATRAWRLAPSAFTLTELLVVITIIAILAALITAGAVNALNAAKRAAISTEIGQLADGIERFKNEQGGAYPPNSINNGTSVTFPRYAGGNIYDQTINDFIRSFRKAFPRHNEPEGLLRRLAGQTGNLTPGTPDPLEGGMNAAEALYFWLGGFSADPVYPISGAGGPAYDASSAIGEVMEGRNRLYEFDLTRLAPRDNSGVFSGRWLTYDNPTGTGGARWRINLWTYTPKNSKSSFAYFDASRHDPINYDVDLSGPVINAKIYPLKKIREGFSSSGTPGTADIHFVNKGKYQILHAGLDDAWGNWEQGSIVKATSANNASNLLLFPTGPFTGDIADTLTNFYTSGTLESAQE